MNDKKTLFDEELVKQLEEYLDGALIEAVVELIDDEIGKRMKQVVKDFNDRLKEMYDNSSVQMTTAINERLDEIHNTMAIVTIETAITKLAPATNELVVFWLPAHFSQEDAQRAGVALEMVIQKRFKYMVFVRGGVDIEIIKGGTVLLPS